MMVAAITTDPKGGTPRPPLLPSERQNGVHQRRPRAREVPSRYLSMSPSSSSTTSTATTTTTNTTSTSNSSSSSIVSRRFPSPLVSRNPRNGSTTPNRSQSVDRRRSGTPKLTHVGEVSAATKLLVTSARSLSVSFQGEVFSLPVSKTKAVIPGASSVRKATPERRRCTPLRGKVDGGGDQVENSKVGDQHRWPARTRQFNMLSRSLNCSDADSNKEFLGSDNVVARALHDTLLDESRRASYDGILDFDSSNTVDVLSRIRGMPDGNMVNESSVPSDTESISSGSTSGAQDLNGGSLTRSGSRGIGSSARFWQETNSRLRRLQDPSLGLSSSPGSKFVTPPKVSVSQSRKFSDCPMSSPRTMSSPIRGAIRAASPSKMASSISSPMRGLSPSRVRSLTGGSLAGSPWDTPSVLSYAVDVRRGKVGENQIVDAHQLRLLHNRHLQWRFVNARAGASLSVQRRNAEKNLWNAWITTTALRDSVRYKRTQVQLLKQKLKLTSILRGQIAYLEEWSCLDEEHSSSLQGATEALKASTLRLPVVGGATADIQSVKEAVGSAIDVMHSMASSVCSFSAKMEEVNSLMEELSNVSSKERVSMERCTQVLSMLAAIQVKDCSLRTHILQLNRSPIA